jgi:hypothetical protein
LWRQDKVAVHRRPGGGVSRGRGILCGVDLTTSGVEQRPDGIACAGVAPGDDIQRRDSCEPRAEREAERLGDGQRDPHAVEGTRTGGDRDLREVGGLRACRLQQPIESLQEFDAVALADVPGQLGGEALFADEGDAGGVGGGVEREEHNSLVSASHRAGEGRE